MKAGWVHDLRALVFKHQNKKRILVMRKVHYCLLFLCKNSKYNY